MVHLNLLFTEMDLPSFGYVKHFLWSQFRCTPPVPASSFAFQTVIITGANTGLGLEAARHAVRLGAARVILAVRNLDKGQAAKESIDNAGHGQAKVVEVWNLDLSSYDSVKAFTKRIDSELDRLDVLLCNAGVATSEYRQAEDSEMTITVNVVSTFLLSLLLVPKMKATASRYNTTPRLSIVSSEVHFLTTFPERNSPDSVFAALNDSKRARMNDRYNVSKLLEVLIVRALVAEYFPSPSPNAGQGQIIMNYMNPGFCHSELMREAPKVLYPSKLLLARTTEVGSRTLVHAAAAGWESHGKYLSNARVEDPAPFVTSEEGRIATERVWGELKEKLERIEPGLFTRL